MLEKSDITEKRVPVNFRNKSKHQLRSIWPVKTAKQKEKETEVLLEDEKGYLWVLTYAATPLTHVGLCPLK